MLKLRGIKPPKVCMIREDLHVFVVSSELTAGWALWTANSLPAPPATSPLCFMLSRHLGSSEMREFQRKFPSEFEEKGQEGEDIKFSVHEHTWWVTQEQAQNTQGEGEKSAGGKSRNLKSIVVWGVPISLWRKRTGDAVEGAERKAGFHRPCSLSHKKHFKETKLGLTSLRKSHSPHSGQRKWWKNEWPNSFSVDAEKL